MAVQESRPPESAELDFAEYEGSAVLIRGHGDSGWVYSAKVIDQATPIVTELVQRVFGTTLSVEKDSDQIVRGYFGLGVHEQVVRVNSSQDYRLHIWARNVETSQGGIQIMTPGPLTRLSVTLQQLHCPVVEFIAVFVLGGSLNHLQPLIQLASAALLGGRPAVALLLVAAQHIALSLALKFTSVWRRLDSR